MNSKQVFRVSLPDIVSQALDQSTPCKSPALWCRLPDSPLENSVAISLRGYLLAIGGSHETVQEQTLISTSRKVSNGLRLETYLMYVSIVPVLCYPVGSSWLLEDMTALSGYLAKLMWHQLYCVLFPGHMLLVCERGLC